MKLSEHLSKYFSSKFFPITLLLFCFLVYGYQFFRMGIYWDGWQAILVSNIDVPNVFWKYYFNDRPFSIWTYLIALPVTGNNPALWQIYGILSRWFAGIGLWFFLRGMFPGRKKESAWITLLWFVFPGFVTQSASIVYCQHFITYGFFNFSLAGMVWSLRKPKRYSLYLILSLFSSLISLFTMEYFIGLEILRPIIIFALLDSKVYQIKARVIRTLKLWLPYLGVFLLFILYRFVFLNSLNGGQSANQPTILSSLLISPVKTIITYFQMMFQDVVYLVLSVWDKTFLISDIDLFSMFYLFSMVMALIVVILLFIQITNWKNSNIIEEDLFTKFAFILAIVSIFFGGIPIWGMGRQVTIGLWSDRFALAPMFGVSILVVFFWTWISKKQIISQIVLAVIIALSAAYQIRIVNQFQNNWVEQERFYWQMMWRIPSLEPGTSVLSPTMPFGSVAEYSIAYAINSIYGIDLNSEDLPYVYLSALRHRYGQIGDFAKDKPVTWNVRTLSFEGSTSDSLVFYEAPKQRCVWFVTPDNSLLPGIDQDTKDLFTISNINQILATEQRNEHAVSQIFGEEIDHNWCYFYQKAELAVQFEDWKGAQKLFNESKQIDEKPKHGRELFPFIIADANLGNWSAVAENSEEATADLSDDISARVCQLWKKIDLETTSSPEKDETIRLLTEKYQCN